MSRRKGGRGGPKKVTPRQLEQSYRDRKELWKRCTRKVQYRSVELALAAITPEIRGVERMHAYLCDCGYFHIGHESQRYRGRTWAVKLVSDELGESEDGNRQSS